MGVQPGPGVRLRDRDTDLKSRLRTKYGRFARNKLGKFTVVESSMDPSSKDVLDEFQHDKVSLQKA